MKIHNELATCEVRKRTDGKKYHVVTFDSVGDWNKASKLENRTEFQGERASRIESQGHKWDLGVDWKKWTRIAETGWAEGVEKIDRLSQKISIPEKLTRSLNIKVSRSWQQSGDEVDVGLYLAGEPECMIEYTPVVAESKIIKISMNSSLPHTKDGIINVHRAVAALAIANALELAGYSCEIVTTKRSGYGHDKPCVVHFDCVLKRPDEFLDLANLSLACHPAWLRRSCFAVTEQYDGPQSDVVRKHCGGSGYGYGTAATGGIKIPVGEDEIYISEEWGTEKQMVAGVLRKLEKFADR